MIAQIGYDVESERITFDRWGLHCGECLEVLLPDKLGVGVWQEVSFEFTDHWYMPGHPGVSPVGLWARKK